MDRMQLSSNAQRRARTRSLIQLGGLVEKAGLVETFGITLGADLQKDSAMKEPVAALFKVLLDINQFVQNDPSRITLVSQKGLEGLHNLNTKFGSNLL